MSNTLTLGKCLKVNNAEKEGAGRGPYQNDTQKPTFDHYWAMVLFTLSRVLPCTAPFPMQNNRGIIIIHITHRNVTMVSDFQMWQISDEKSISWSQGQFPPCLLQASAIPRKQRCVFSPSLSVRRDRSLQGPFRALRLQFCNCLQ